MMFFLFLYGFTFKSCVELLNRAPTNHTVAELFFGWPLFWFPFLLTFPILTMRLFSEEYRSGTIESLMTAPVGDAQVVLAKFFGALIFYMVLWVPTLGFFGVFWWVSGQAPAETVPAMLGGYLLVFLAGALYISMGCLASSLTSNQIVAAFITLSATCTLFFINLLWSASTMQHPVIREAAYYVSTTDHMRDFTHGIFDTRPFVFYLSVTAFMLFLTYHALQYRRWRV